MCHSRRYLPTDTKKKVESNEEESETSIEDSIEDLEALDRELFDFNEVAENRRSIMLQVPLCPDRPYSTGIYPSGKFSLNESSRTRPLLLRPPASGLFTSRLFSIETIQTTPAKTFCVAFSCITYWSYSKSSCLRSSRVCSSRFTFSGNRAPILAVLNDL